MPILISRLCCQHFMNPVSADFLSDSLSAIRLNDLLCSVSARAFIRRTKEMGQDVRLISLTC